MAYQKPMVSIELAEYLALTQRPVIEGTSLTEEEYLACTTTLVIIALDSRELITRPPKEGITLNTHLGVYRAMIKAVQTKNGQIQQFLFTKPDTNGS
jgi:hypothetical protein